MSALTIKKENFQKEILNSDKPVLLGLLGQLVRPMPDGFSPCR